MNISDEEFKRSIHATWNSVWLETLEKMLQEVDLEIPEDIQSLMHREPRKTVQEAFEFIKGRQAIKDLESEYIERQEAMGYDYSKKPESYSHWDWCGQCNRSLKKWDDEHCDCVD